MEGIDPAEVVIVGLVTGVQQGETIGRFDAVTVVDDVAALMAGVDVNLEACEGLDFGAVAGQDGELLLKLRFLTEDVGRGNNGLFALEEEAGDFGVGVVGMPMTDEEGVGRVGKADTGLGAHLKAGVIGSTANEVNGEAGLGRIDEPAVVIELDDAAAAGAAGTVEAGLLHTVAVPTMENRLGGGGLDVENVIEADEGGAVQRGFRGSETGGLELPGGSAGQHVIDPGKRTRDPFVGGVFELGGGESAAGRGKVRLGKGRQGQGLEDRAASHSVEKVA